MIENRELTMDDYLAMLRRRTKVILIPALIGPLLGFLAYLVVDRYFAKYTSESLVLVENQKVPENMVQPVVSDDLQARIQMLKAVATSDTEMRPMLARLFPGKSSQQIDGILDDIRTQPLVTMFSDLSQVTGAAVKRKPGQSNSPAFTVSYSTSDPKDAQRICEAITSKIVDKNMKFIADNAKGTVDVLTQGLGDAKRNLDDMDGKLAAFKKQYVGQLPGDEENNLKILTGLNSQLEANTQTLNRAQQDKSYTESMLAQQIAVWKSSQSSSNPQTLEKQLSELQSQLLDLQARYTEDHPDVIKTKADISEVKKKLAEVNKASTDAPDASTEKASANEPPEIRQMRLQVHQNADSIALATREQKRLQQEIASYQGRISLSPTVEEQYKELTRDYENANKTYQDLLADKSKADLTANMNSQAQGESMRELQQASMPDDPTFPNKWLFTGAGLGAGLALGFGILLWLELRDKSIRNEADAEAALQLPLLVAVPWVGVPAEQEQNGKFKFWHRKTPDEQKESERVGV
jgi:protein tyrosine kinase modulator